jgi:DNA-binding NtrC family response regulator
METPVVAVVGSAPRAHLGCLRKLEFRGVQVVGLDATVSLARLANAQRVGLVVLACSSARHAESLAAIRDIQGQTASVPIILIAEHSSEDLAIAALKAGVADYFRPPVSCDAVLASVGRCLERTQQSLNAGPIQQDSTQRASLSSLIGSSPAMRSLRQAMERVAAVDSTVLITGETGTGKELVASAIHDLSPRHDKPLVCVNCAAIPDSLVESELFGYEKGAFTGAQHANAGSLQAADGGTIFLDEIGDMPLPSQAKILRAIETKELQRVGSRRALPVDFRVIAATNHDLAEATLEGRFRKDLYFRLDVARLHLPPLRERMEDIPLLCRHFIRYFNSRFALQVADASTDFLACLCRYTWPGNVRELRNVMEAVFINHPAQVLAVSDLPESIANAGARPSHEPTEQEEYQQLLDALLEAKWNKTKAAEALHWSRMTLYRKMRKYHVDSSPTQSIQ